MLVAGAAMVAPVGSACRPAAVDPPDGSGAIAAGAEARDAGASEGGAADPDAPALLPPIPDQPLFTNLEVPGFPEAVVALPNGARTRRPVLVILHGTADRPDWNCDAWRHITTDSGFVLCPRHGSPRPRGHRGPVGPGPRGSLDGPAAPGGDHGRAGVVPGRGRAMAGPALGWRELFWATLSIGPGELRLGAERRRGAGTQRREPRGTHGATR